MADKDEPVATPEEAETDARTKEPEPEVQPHEFTAGIGKPVAGSAWPEEIVEVLRAPLDPNRVRRRQGRGTGQLEYLAGHDVKRRASEIFGFGNWGHWVKVLEEIDAIPVVSREGNKDGWHVGYRCIVTVWIRHEGGRFETEGVGYGDGVEYTPSARVTACELAMKEAETDALKRAFTDLGDQFGLILYAKGDEKQRIDRERNRGDAESRPAVAAPPPGPKPPQSWPEALDRFDRLVVDEGSAAVWLEELVAVRYGVGSLRELTSEQRQVVFIGFSSALMALEEEEGDIALAPGLREKIAAAFAAKNESVALVGPPWRLGPGEDTLPTREEHFAAGADGKTLDDD